MTAYVTSPSGLRWRLPQAVCWRMEYTSGTPCDSFWLRCPWDGDNSVRPEEWTGFLAMYGGERVFTGVVDECEVSLSRRGRLLEVSGRGMAARLLDNEALGQDYQTATQKDIIRDHVRPYGITVAPGAQLPAVAQFSVATGSSEWSVVYDFARYYGGVAPRFDRQGRLVLSGWKDSRERVVDDSTPVLSLVRRDRRYGTLSQVLVRDRWSGRVQISSYYQTYLRGADAPEVRTYLEEKLRRARWLMATIEKRQHTITALAEALLQLQGEFFLGGELASMTLRQAAGRMGVHESTVSRAVSGKYLRCARGTFPIRFFFSTGVRQAEKAGEEPASLSRNSVKERIRRLIREEDAAKPLSDEDIRQLLYQAGITLSRRVVTKYRQECGIPSSLDRRMAPADTP